MSADRVGRAPPTRAGSGGETFPRPDVPAASTLWFGMLGGPLAWVAAFVATYLIAESACVRGGNLVSAGVIWLLAVAVGVAAAMSAWRAGGATRAAGEEGPARSPNREPLQEPGARTDRPAGRRFLSAAGTVLSSVFAFVSLVQALPLFVGVGC